MTNPFAVHDVDTLIAAVDALQATIVATWTRILAQSHWLEVIDMTVICWLGTSEVTDETGAARIQESLRQVWRTLDAVAAAEPGGETQVQLKQCATALSAKEPSLKGLVS